MKHIDISRQRAVAICQAEGIDYRMFDHDNVLNHCASGVTITGPGTALLRTLAKLYRCSDGSFHIGGYAADGSDVKPYER